MNHVKLLHLNLVISILIGALNDLANTAYLCNPSLTFHFNT